MDHFSGGTPEWDRVGEIEDIVLNRDGVMTGIVAEVGGFLDIGDYHVTVPIEDVKLVPATESTYAVVTPYTSQAIAGLKKVGESFFE